MQQSPSKIFKSDFRVWNQEKFGFVADFFSDDENTGSLISLKEIILENGGEIQLEFQEARTILILPVYGEISTDVPAETVGAGESLLATVPKGSTLKIRNSLEGEKTDLLLFEFEVQEPAKQLQKTSLDFTVKNKLNSISENLQTPNFIGLFTSRSEGIYTLKNQAKSIFAMVIYGAFEFQNRLLETRDAVLLWELSDIEFEALSDDALLIFFEI